MPKSVSKVIAYITRGRSLLVFTHADAPEAGLQVPAGTVEAGESFRQAVLRESHEETGLEGLAIRSHLGDLTYDFTPNGRAELHERQFFWLTCPADAPDTWSHSETSGGTSSAIPFCFYWHDLDSGDPELAAEQGALLQGMRDAS